MKKLVLVLLFTAFTNFSEASTLNPIFQGSIRDIPKDGIGDFLNGNFQHGNLTALNAEDRGIVEFDLKSFDIVQSAYLISAEQFNSVGSTISLSLYGYAGDGAFSLSDFSLGNKLFSFEHKQGESLNLDVTNFVNTAITLGHDLLGFNLRQDTITRSGIVVYQSVQMDVSRIPEPPSVWLFALALCVLHLINKRLTHVV